MQADRNRPVGWYFVDVATFTWHAPASVHLYQKEASYNRGFCINHIVSITGMNRFSGASPGADYSQILTHGKSVGWCGLESLDQKSISVFYTLCYTVCYSLFYSLVYPMFYAVLSDEIFLLCSFRLCLGCVFGLSVWVLYGLLFIPGFHTSFAKPFDAAHIIIFLNSDCFCGHYRDHRIIIV